MIMDEQLTIFSQNCRGGLSVAAKRRDLFQYLRSKKYNIICLQDTHINTNLEAFIKAEWGYEAFFSSYTTNSRGVMILINNNFEQKVNRVKIDKNGNYIILDITIEDQKITLVNLYGPNNDNPQFYENLKHKINEFENEQVIMCGDWNLVIDPTMDSYNYLHINNPRARQVILNHLEDENFIDPWRVMHEDIKKYTWRRLNPIKKQARLDFFLIHESIFQYVTDSDIIPGYRTDHSAIILKFKFQENERGKGYWKFNNSLLKDKTYIEEIKKTIEEVKATYATNSNLGENITNEDLLFNINDQLFLETLLMIIRGNTIKYSSIKKKEMIKEEKNLEQEIKIMECEINNDFVNSDLELIQTLAQKQERLVEIRKNKIEGVMLRSKARYEDLGEKPTKYFLNLENRHFTNKVMNKLIDDDDSHYTDTKDILNCQKRFYQKLYEEVKITNERPIENILGNNDKKLSNHTAESLEGEILLTELSRALKDMKNDKSPGLDGFTIEFFKFFWIDLGIFVLRSLNYGYRTGNLSVTQKQGVITCLPKPNKNRHYLKNWRPISLLNVVYKLASSVIANRIKTVLRSLIHQDQTGFVSGRFIGENVKLIYDILFETKNQELPGLILSVDFEKAFDTVSWQFIEKVLKYFNFGPSVISWVKLFQNGSESCIIQNGFMSEFLKLNRGCRQGDPISPYIFILCAEILGQMIRKSDNLHGIEIQGKEFRLSQYADDTQIFLNGTENSLQEALSILNTFYEMSGLKINVEKTKAIWVGSFSNSLRQMCSNYKLDWTQGPFKILGVTFTTEVFNIWDVNANEIVAKAENLCKQWSKRKLTLFGRITVIKSLVLSKFNHLFLALPNPPGELIKQLEKLFYKFLWNSGPDRIKRSIIVKDLRVGGLRMVNISSFIKALKITWLRRIIQNSQDNSWYALSNIDFQKVFSFGSGFASHYKQHIYNPFWKEILQNWAEFCNTIKIESIDQVLNSPLWYNKNLLNGGNIYIADWYEKGLRQISDLIDEQGNIYSFDVLKGMYNLRGTFLDFQALIRKIPNDWKIKLNDNKIVSNINRYNVNCNLYVQQLIKDRRGCRRLYDLMVDANTMILNEKWDREIPNILAQDWKNYYSVIKSLKEVKLKDFQYKVNNKILVTKSFLNRINKIDNNLCEYCHREAETIYHLFIECEKVKQFWGQLSTWLIENSNLSLNLEEKNILFAYQDNNQLRNYLYVIAKRYIYVNKFSGRQLNLNTFTAILQRKFQTERYIAHINDTMGSFFGKWSHLYNNLRN